MMETTLDDVIKLFDNFVSFDAPTLPLAGTGATWQRFSTLADWASIDLSLGRLCEGHADALAILTEAQRAPVAGASYGVWASRGGAATTFAERVPGGWILSGTKEFCSGSGFLDRALVTAVTGEGYLLFDVSTSEHVISRVEDSWPAVGMANSASHTLEFGGPPIGDEQLVGGANFYTDRSGFWHGSCAVASCWFGGAVGLLNGLIQWINAEPDDLVLAGLGAIFADLETMRFALKDAASEIDDDPHDVRRQSKMRALVTRQVVHGAALRVLQGTALVGGARPLCHDASQSRRAADLFAYLSQHHGTADTREVGQLLTNVRVRT